MHLKNQQVMGNKNLTTDGLLDLPEGCEETSLWIVYIDIPTRMQHHQRDILTVTPPGKLKEIRRLRTGVGPKSAVDFDHYVGSSQVESGGKSRVHQHYHEAMKELVPDGPDSPYQARHYAFTRKEDVAMNLCFAAIYANSKPNANDPYTAGPEILLLVEGLMITYLGSLNVGPHGYVKFHPRIVYDFVNWL
ncbi:hypothetical protein PG996_012911 [Apiospora saccharicola]|uniref:Uncharacterized protein n=1 Tax=Apiospora saccharicola TaxID=335842 RepID=A0ABR1U3Z9_9PEZI